MERITPAPSLAFFFLRILTDSSLSDIGAALSEAIFLIWFADLFPFVFNLDLWKGGHTAPPGEHTMLTEWEKTRKDSMGILNLIGNATEQESKN